MLFSIPESGWWVIAAAATAIFAVGMRATAIKLMRIGPAELLGPAARWSKGKQRALFYLLGPALCFSILGLNLLRPDPPSTILFLYSAVIVSVPAAFYPVCGRFARQVVAQQQKPGTKVKIDWATKAWVYGILSTVCLLAALAAMAGHRWL